VIPLAVAERIFVKVLTNGKVKSAEIVKRLRTQFGVKTFSRTQVYPWSKSLKEDWTEVENMRRLHLLQGKLWPALLGLRRRLIHRFSDRTMNQQHSLLLEAS
jgi:hypothetical protein